MYVGNARTENIALSVIPIEVDIQIIRAEQISKRVIINDDSKRAKECWKMPVLKEDAVWCDERT